tara:strand:+ start:3065 stop:3865 length:801 start_codon:yes stop_codon:yes gene_type:complete
MFLKDRLFNYKSYSNPYPILEIRNFLTSNEAKEAVEILKNSSFDEMVMSGRKNIRKGTAEFSNFIDKHKIFRDLYNFLNDKEQYLYLYDVLTKISKDSQLKYSALQIANKFDKNYYEYKRDIHSGNLLKKLFNFAKLKTPYLIKKLFTSLYFEMSFSFAKRGYKLKTHRDKNTRIIVLLIYLNDLEEQDGGYLEIYSDKNIENNNVKGENNFDLKMKIKPESGKLVAFISNPNSFHNVSEIKHQNVERFFCYGSYSSNNEIIWKKY